MAGFVGFVAATGRTGQPGLVSETLARLLPGEGRPVERIVREELGLGVGWTAEAVDGPRARMIANAGGDVCLVFVGENFHDFGAGTAGFDPSDLRPVLAAYEREGRTALERINGWFSGVLIDARAGRVLVFNDRYGLSRIYVHEAPAGFYFASRPAPLLGALPALRSLDVRGLGEWFACGCSLQNRTLFTAVTLLPAGSVWSFHAGGRRTRERLFEPSVWETQAALSPAEYEEALRALFPRVLRRYLQGSQPVGMSITGGLDGRMIMAWAGAAAGTLPCYTFNGPYHPCQDLQLGRRIAAACGQPHRVIDVGNDFLAQFPALAARTVEVSGGTMDVSGAVEVYVNRIARDVAPIRLTGNYGSELLRGNVAFRPSELPADWLTPELTAAVQAAGRTYASERQGDALSFIAFKQVPWHHHARLSVEQSQLTVRSPFLDNDLVGLAFRAPAAVRTAVEPSLRLIEAGQPALTRIPTDRGLVYPPTRLTQLRRAWEEFWIKVEYGMDYGMPAWFARTAGPWLGRGLERRFLGRQKFYHFRTWYRRELAPFVREVLLDARSRSRPWYRPGAVERMVEAHTQGRGNHTREIHRMLTLELLERQLTA